MKRRPEGQLPLYDRRDIQARFEEFNAKNPEIYRLLVRFAREAKAAGFPHYGMKSLYERLRWHVHIETKGDPEFKLNNDFTSRYARRIRDLEWDLREFFRTRELKA